mmetsp:Transcript_14003/g.33090  ORF Transcript_14003/g.33090 Transcript_14003/m.33090 type:complete len:274 (+) Transcript_14003:599-1420(+)
MQRRIWSCLAVRSGRKPLPALPSRRLARGVQGASVGSACTLRRGAVVRGLAVGMVGSGKEGHEVLLLLPEPLDLVPHLVPLHVVDVLPTRRACGLVPLLLRSLLCRPRFRLIRLVSTDDGRLVPPRRGPLLRLPHARSPAPLLAPQPPVDIGLGIPRGNVIQRRLLRLHEPADDLAPASARISELLLEHALDLDDLVDVESQLGQVGAQLILSAGREVAVLVVPELDLQAAQLLLCLGPRRGDRVQRCERHIQLRLEVLPHLPGLLQLRLELL